MVGGGWCFGAWVQTEVKDCGMGWFIDSICAHPNIFSLRVEVFPPPIEGWA